MGQTLKKVTKKQRYRATDPFFLLLWKTKLQSYKVTDPFFSQRQKKATKKRRYRVTDPNQIFGGRKKATTKRRYRATDPVLFQRKKSYKETKIQSYRCCFFVSQKKSYKETKIQSYRPDFFSEKKKKATKKRRYEATSYLSWARPWKKLQRNKDTAFNTDPFFSSSETKLQSYKATDPFFLYDEKKATKKRRYRVTHPNLIFGGRKKATKKRRYRATDPGFFREKKSYKETKIESYRCCFFVSQKKSYKETKIQSYRPNFFLEKKKLQRNEDTKLQATFLGPDLEKSYKETKIQSNRPIFFLGKKLPSYRATKPQTPLFLQDGKKATKKRWYKVTDPNLIFGGRKKKLQRNEDTKLQSYKTAIPST